LVDLSGIDFVNLSLIEEDNLVYRALEVIQVNDAVFFFWGALSTKLMRMSPRISLNWGINLKFQGYNGARFY
jgi:hypothetical protein